MLQGRQMKSMPQSAKALKLVGDVHASNSTGREKGVDPDAPEEDEENDVDDAEGEPEEAELL